MNPFCVSIFRTLYRRLIVELLQFLRLQHEYTSAVLPTSTVAEESESSKRGRKRRDPDRIGQLFTEEKRKRALWYRQQQQQYLQQQQQQEEEENQMLDDILSSLQTTIDVSPSTATIPPSTHTSTGAAGGYGQYRKNIENCCSSATDASPSPPPTTDDSKPKRRRRTRDTTMR